MRVKCFGTTGYHPSLNRHTACYYLPDQSLLLDAGTGMFRLTESLRIEPRSSLDILISHAHLDHIVGLTFLLDTLAVTTLEHVRVIGESQKLEAIRQHLYNELIFPVRPTMEFAPLPDKSGTMLLDTPGVEPHQAVALEWFPLAHPGGSLGYILTCSGPASTRRLAYITDTTARSDSDYIEKLSDVDLLLHECYFSDDYEELAAKTGHSCISAVTDVVRRSHPKQTVLIHINPLSELLDSEFQLDVEQKLKLNMRIAEDGLVLNV